MLAPLAQAMLAVTSPDRIPAEPPIGGPFWTLVVPAILFGLSFVATYLLYRRFQDGSGNP